jgi:cell division protein DivIC
MHSNTSTWDNLTGLIIILILLACVSGVIRWYWPVIETNERMRKELRRMTQEVRKEEEVARQLRSSINALQHDPDTVERLIREKLGYAKPGETVIRFEDNLPLANFSIRPGTNRP